MDTLPRTEKKVRKEKCAESEDAGRSKRFVNGKKISIRRCAVLERRPPELTRENFVGQPLKVELYEKKMEAVEGGRSKKTGRRLHVSWRRFV